MAQNDAMRQSGTDARVAGSYGFTAKPSDNISDARFSLTILYILRFGVGLGFLSINKATTHRLYAQGLRGVHRVRGSSDRVADSS